MNGPGRLVVESWSPEYGAPLEEGVGSGDADTAAVEVDVDVELPAGQWRPLLPRAAPAEHVAFIDGTRRVDARLVWHPAAAGPDQGSGRGPRRPGAAEGEPGRLGAPEGEPGRPGAAEGEPGRPGAAEGEPGRPGAAGGEPGTPERGPGHQAGARAGIAASVAAGAVVVAGGRAWVAEVVVQRWLIVEGAQDPLVTRSATWRPRRPRGDDPVTLSVELQQAMADAEVATAAMVHDTCPALDLVVVDGPIRRREGVAGVVGHIKTHHRSYLPPPLDGLVAGLPAGHRTPLFRVGGGGDRYAWYLRLPGPADHAWAAIVRGEAPGGLSIEDAAARADQAAATLGRFASRPARDPRAPQNLVPVGGLEVVLRHRLGDPYLLYRALRTAAA